MSGKYLLDTNIVIALFAEDPSVQKRIAKAAEVFIPGKGHPVPENDIWIAALALENNLTLVTRDEHFKKIDELKKVVW